jgi:hypothetical protein
LSFFVVVQDARIDSVDQGFCCELSRVAMVPFINAFAEVAARDVSRNECACGENNSAFYISLALSCLDIMVYSSTVTDRVRSTAE